MTTRTRPTAPATLAALAIAALLAAGSAVAALAWSGFGSPDPGYELRAAGPQGSAPAPTADAVAAAQAQLAGWQVPHAVTAPVHDVAEDPAAARARVLAIRAIGDPVAAARAELGGLPIP